MSYTGKVKNGVVMLPPEATLAEGTEVEMTSQAAPEGMSSFLEGRLKRARLRDWPAVFALNHGHYVKGHPKQS